MVNSIPSSWTYTANLENLFFFYQASEELLSYSSPDSFRLPVCNTITLCYELHRIYGFLLKNRQVDRYYSKYIPCIIDELIKSIQDDHVLKQFLGLRLSNIVTGLTVAKGTPSELLKWTNMICQMCTVEQHMASCKAGIVQNVLSGNNKTSLLWYIQNYYIDLITIGYSPEFLHQSIIRYFDNRDTPIDSADSISTFLAQFDNSSHSYEFYVVADTYKLDNLARTNPQFGQSFDIQEIDESQIVKLKKSSGRLRKFYSIYADLKKRGTSNIKILSCKASGIDPYSAFNDILQIFDLAQCLEGYFKHKAEKRIFFDIVLVSDANYTSIKIRRVIPNRPYVDQSIIDSRIDTMMNSDLCKIDVFVSILKAMDMHLDALNCKNSETMLRSFWTALETLFFASDEAEQKENAKFALLHIIQKTYILKQFRLIYGQMISAIPDDTFWEKNGIDSFKKFVSLFMSVQADDADFKKFTTPLSTNPLLRTRIYCFRKELSNCKSIQQKIENHREKVSWQIDRIYRTRNLSTHAGISMPYINEILFNMHNYFDYVINYIICKLENGNYIQNISTMVFEAKIDNQIHIELLKRNVAITGENYLNILFGPDLNIISFNFEAVVSDTTQEQDL